MHADTPGHLVANGVQVSATVVVDHALGVAGGAGGVVQGNGLPLVFGPVPVEFGVAFGEEGFVVQIAQGFAFAVLGIVDIDDQNRALDQLQRLTDDLVKLTVGDQHAGFTVIEHKGDGFGVQTHVQGVEHGADHGYTKVAFQHGGDIGQHRGNGIALTNAPTI